jgi:hypothetical protein
VNLESRKAEKESVDEREGGHPNGTVPSLGLFPVFLLSRFKRFQELLARLSRYAERHKSSLAIVVVNVWV